MSSSNQIIYLVPLHLAPEAREALAEVGEVRVVLGLRGLDPLDVVADGDDFLCGVNLHYVKVGLSRRVRRGLV